MALPEALVLVGRRRKALDAADALGVPVVLISDRPVAKYPCLIARLPVHGADDDASLAHLAGRIRAECRPLAVLALTENSVLPSAQIREALGLPGLTPAAAIACTDKLEMKRRIRAAGLHCADFCAAEDELHRQDLIERLGMPMIIKQRLGSGGRGTRLVTRESDVPERLEPGSMAERIVSGKEMSIESFLMDGKVLFSNISDYFEPAWANIVPGELAERRRSEVESMNARALGALSLEHDVTHVEFFVQEKRVVFGEVAARPPGGHLMDLIGLAWGFDAWQASIRIALGDAPSFPRRTSRYAGVRILHPGRGVVDAIEGVSELSALPAVRQISLSGFPGRRYASRTGVGEEAGHVIVCDPELGTVKQALRKAARVLRFRMRKA